MMSVLLESKKALFAARWLPRYYPCVLLFLLQLYEGFAKRRSVVLSQQVTHDIALLELVKYFFLGC